MIKSPEWPKVRMKEIYEGFWDGPHATPKKAESGPVFLGIKNITEDGHLNLTDIRHISEEDFPKWIKRAEPKPGDIVFTYEATLHRYAMIPKGFRGCLGRRVALIRPNRNKIDARYLFYYFFSSEWREEVSQYMIMGSTVDRIPLIMFPDFEIYLPPLPTQRKIASILSAYDELIENNSRRIEILEEMAQAIHREWFVKYKFPGHENLHLIDSGTELGLIPEEWTVTKLEKVCTIIMGQSPKSEFYNTNGEGLPFHQGVTNFGRIFPTTKVYCTVENRIAQAGDILFSVRAPVGRMNLSTSKMVIGRGLCAIRNSDISAFVYYQLKNRFTEEDMIGGGTIFKSVTKGDMHNLEFLLPSDEILSQFVILSSDLIKMLELLSEKNAVLHKSRNLLISKLVSGELDVRQLEI